MAFGKKKPTAEQKLLQMIEATQGGAAVVGKSSQKVAQKQNVLTLLKTLNTLLVLGVIGTLVFLFNEIADGAKLASQKIDIKAPKEAIERASDAQPEVASLSNYMDVMKRRNIFMPYEEKTTAVAVSPDQSTSRIHQKAAKLHLVGISWLDSADTASVMIEDTEKQETYFLQKGEKMGDIVIKTIYADSALLGYENEEMIIKYDKPQM
jgi:hypothetical protein